MPRPLKIGYWGSCFFAAVGWVLVVAAGRSVHDFLLMPVLLLPLAVTFALGFSEQQTWTRPLAVLVLAIPALLAWLVGATHLALPLAVLPVGAGLYLYRSRGCRVYYGALRDMAVVRLSAADLTDPFFVPLYTAAAGIVAGGCLGYWIVIRDLGSSGLSVNDGTGLVFAMVLGAAVLGAVGFCCGEAILSRRQRAD